MILIEGSRFLLCKLQHEILLKHEHPEGGTRLEIFFPGVLILFIQTLSTMVVITNTF